MSSIGDVVLTEPVVAAVRAAHPDAGIGFALKERFRELVGGNPALDRVHTLPDDSFKSLNRLALEIREAGYTHVIDLHSNARSRYLSRRSGASVVSRYAKRDRFDGALVRVLRRPYRASKRTVERYLDALEPLGIPHPYARPRFHLPSGAAAAAASVIGELGLPERGFAVVVPGSVWATKMWPEERFASLSTRLTGDLDLPVVALGGPAERDLCSRVADASGARSAAGLLSLGAAAALVSRAALFVGNDSGLTHISMALDVPTVAVFGPTDPSQFDFERHALIYAGLQCSACSFFGGRRCRSGHWDCMLKVGVDEVLAAAVELLERRARE